MNKPSGVPIIQREFAIPMEVAFRSDGTISVIITLPTTSTPATAALQRSLKTNPLIKLEE